MRTKTIIKNSLPLQIPPQITMIWTSGSQRSGVVALGLPVGTKGTRGNDTKA